MNSIQKTAKRILISGAIVSLAFIVNNSDAQHGNRGSGGISRSRVSGGSLNNGGIRNFDRSQSFARPQTSVQSRPSFNARPDRNVQAFNRPSINNVRQPQFDRNNSPVVRNPRIVSNTIVKPSVRYIPRPVPRTNVTVNVGVNYGHGYRYGHGYPYGGFYYGGGYHYYPVYYRPYLPHYGIRINVLPFGYYPFYFNSYPYYFYNGLYYRQYNDYYETVEPPLGARVPELPSGATSVKIDGQKYYEHNGTYYQKVYNERGETLYEVVGADGVLETDKAKQTEFHTQFNEETSYLSQLPNGSKTIQLDGKTYYVSPSGDYYTQLIDKDNRAYYALAGNESTL